MVPLCWPKGATPLSLIPLVEIDNTLVSAGMSTPAGTNQHFCCQCPMSNPRPVLNFSLKTTLCKVFDYFVKPQNGLDWPVFCVLMISEGFYVKSSIIELEINFYTETSYRTRNTCVKIVRA